jgi:hypothetical protein
VIRLLLLAAALANAQPNWTSIATPSDGWQFFRYDSLATYELSGFDAKNPHPPRDYDFATGPVKQRTTCPLEDRADVHWYTPDGKKLAGTFTTPNPTVFNVSALQKGMHGFGATGDFVSHGARHPGAMAIVYFTDRPCSDGGTEYGFSHDESEDNVLVYWSTYANCGNDGLSLCRKSDDPSLGGNFSNVQQENSGTKVNHGFRIYGLQPGELTYKMFVDNHKFRVQVWRGSQLATCSKNGGKQGPCDLSEAVESWFPIDRVHDGFIVAGTQTAGNAQLPADYEFRVSDILILK